MSTEDFFKRLANLLNERTNPTDLKASMIGKVVKLSPITIQIDNGNALLVENDELEISEWFRFRCNIDKNKALSSDVPTNLEQAKAVTEVHSYGGTPCQMQELFTLF